MFDKFVGVYKLSKTLRFELKPIGKTLENIEKNGALDRDLARSREYEKVKTRLDLEHKALIERVASRFDEIVLTDSNGKKNVDWLFLANAYEAFRKSDKDKKDRDALDKVTSEYRKMFAMALSSDEYYAELTESTPSKFFKTLIKVAESEGKDPEQAIEMFSKFACYFKGYQENRKNIYSAEAKATSAANRAINENFPKFLDCCLIFGYIQENYPSIVCDTEKELASILKGRKLAEVFSIFNYSKFLSQSGIDDFNNIVGGYVPVQGEKLRGINEFINLSRQQNEDAKIDRKLAKMPRLFKQILSDRETISFVAESFTEDGHVLDAVKKFGDSLVESGAVEKIQALLYNLEPRNGIFIDREQLATVSRRLCGDWSALGRVMETIVETREKSKAKREKLLKRAEYPIVEFVGARLPDDSTDDGFRSFDIADAWKNDAAIKTFNEVSVAFAEAQNALKNKEAMGLRERSQDVELIKKYLDAVMAVLHLVKPLHVSAELERDMEFYGEFDELYNQLDEVVPLYNRVRNYVTKKNCEADKMKLMFDCPTLADGWDENKEKQNKAILLERDGSFYLGVCVGSAFPNFKELAAKSGESCYRKMVYKLLPGPNKMLPKVFFAKNPIVNFDPDDELLERYRAGDYKKGPSFDIRFCHRLIDFFKASIAIHPDWCKFGFEFSPTSSYSGIDEFYREINEQGYKISFVNVSSEKIDALVDSGIIYLFRLHNKDFSAGANGRMNLHTIYWKMLFDPSNLRNVVYKLNGEAELFYRKATISRPYAHKVGEKMVNRRDNDGNPIPEIVTKELLDFANGRRAEEELSEVARAYLNEGRVTIKDVKHEIVKDARYTMDKFFFHCPITINAKAADKPSKFNSAVNALLKDSDEPVNVIGIDRGERHLLYVTVINQKGEILEQRSFNTLGHETYDGKMAKFDYHAKLDQAEKARDAARKSWTEIGRIKDLKAGYLSVVVHELAQMMIKYNAVIALEDLNFGFKRGRFAIEKQVYQKFEKALIDKLNYLVFKDRAADVHGGSLRGYQLTSKFESFKALGKQTGFIYYVPAAYTSKIDPTTGFTNLFDTKKCKNVEGAKEFLGTFDSIRFSEADNAFAFAFDYKNFNLRLKGYKTSWTVYSADRRLVFDKHENREKEIFPTRMITEALARVGEKVVDGYDLLAYLRGLEPTRENARVFRDVFYAFDRTLQMRNSRASTGDDYIQSPVKNADGAFFDSRTCGEDLPQNADANGAYHIALKGLWIINEALRREWKNGVPELKLEHEEWFRFAQSRV